MCVDVSCACRLCVTGARALWTFGPFPAATSIKLSCSIGDAVGINRHLKRIILIHNSRFNLGGTRSAQAQQIPVSMCFAETVQNPDSSQVNGL